MDRKGLRELVGLILWNLSSRKVGSSKQLHWLTHNKQPDEGILAIMYVPQKSNPRQFQAYLDEPKHSHTAERYLPLFSLFGLIGQ